MIDMHPNIQTVHDMFLAELPVGPDGKTPQYPAWLCEALNLLDRRVGSCGCRCSWNAPYGWVVEAGCPVHDA